MTYLSPQPDAIGIIKTKELYLKKYNKVLSDGEAEEILGKVMRHLYLVNDTCSNTQSTSENLTTINQ